MKLTTPSLEHLVTETIWSAALQAVTEGRLVKHSMWLTSFYQQLQILRLANV